MPRHPSTAIAFASILSVAALSSTLSAQYEKAKPSPSPSPGMEPASTRPMEPAGTPGPSSAAGMSLTATLVDPETKARQQAATVKVTTRGLRIVDPALSGEKPIKRQGHLHYQLDDGPVIATTAPKLSFHGLKPGSHTILVALAANDHTPLGPEQKLSVTIPER